MSIDAGGAALAAPHLMNLLASHLKITGNSVSVSQALEDAIQKWIDADRERRPQAAGPSRGYQWKALFLPDTTELRMACADAQHYGRVVGDQIIFEGRSVSPRGMTLAIAGDGRNAWRDLWLKLPGQRHWKQAIRCRREVERAMATPPQSPVDAMSAAAAAMSDALKTALTLVEHSNAQTARKFERRGSKHRRESDILGESCAFD
jgi:hypothetical protein